MSTLIDDSVLVKRPLDEKASAPKVKVPRLVFASHDIEALVAAVKELLQFKKEEGFPERCLKAARGPLGALIDKASTRDRIGIPQQEASGKGLTMILVIAVAIATYGSTAVDAERAIYDKTRTDMRCSPSRNYISWVRAHRKTSEMLGAIDSTRWSQLKIALAEAEEGAVEKGEEEDAVEFEELSDEDIGVVPQRLTFNRECNTFECIGYCTLHRYTSLDMQEVDSSYKEGFVCDSCSTSYDDMMIPFSHCSRHGFDHCHICCA